MSAGMELHVALSMRLDAIEAYRLANNYRAEVLRNEATNLRRVEREGVPQGALGTKTGLLKAALILDERADLAGEKSSRQADATPFFQPGHTYTREHHGQTAEFRVRSIDTHPDHGGPVAFGWYRRQPRTTWHAYTSDDYLDGWNDTTQGDHT